MISDTAWKDRPTLSVWVYDSARGAAAGQTRLTRLSQRGAVAVVDAVTVTWVGGAHRPRIGFPHAGPLGGLTGLDRRPLGVLLGRLLFPQADDADGPAALAQVLGPTGVDEQFLRQVRDALVPDTSALLVLSRRAALDDVREVMERGVARGDVRLLHAVLTADALPVVEALARPDGSWRT